MARPLRIEFEGALYHITARGNARGNIVIDDRDRQRWLEALGETCDRFNWACYSYCLMDNHYHCLIETPEGNLSQGMRQLNGSYTQFFNRQHRRVGHLFQGRYLAILVEKETYLLELCRYIVLNPVRAKMVEAVLDWPWSSYRSAVGATAPPAWLDVKWQLSCFGSSMKEARRLYIEFVAQGLGRVSPLKEIKNQIYLGSESFVQSVQKAIEEGEDLSEVPKIQKRGVAKPLAYYEQNSNTQSEAMARAYLSGSYSMRKIAKYFDVHYATVSRAVKQHEGKVAPCKT